MDTETVFNKKIKSKIKNKCKDMAINSSRVFAISTIFTICVLQNSATVINSSNIKQERYDTTMPPLIISNNLDNISLINSALINNSLLKNNESIENVEKTENIQYTTTMPMVIPSLEPAIIIDIPINPEIVEEIEEEPIVEEILWTPSEEITLFPNVQVEPPKEVIEVTERTMYLTFDDGPSEVTLEILDILARYDIKATFFVTAQNAVQRSEPYLDILRRIVDEGHAIGVHSYTHNYNIYKTEETFFEDFSLIFEHIKEATGVSSNIFRFAGGSRNDFNRHIYKDLIEEITNRGFVYFDWNVSNDDSTGTYQTEAQLIQNVKNTFGGRLQEVVLMHDMANKQNTALALDDIIRFGIEQGYEFAPLTNQVPPIVF